MSEYIFYHPPGSNPDEATAKVEMNSDPVTGVIAQVIIYCVSDLCQRGSTQINSSAIIEQAKQAYQENKSSS